MILRKLKESIAESYILKIIFLTIILWGTAFCVWILFRNYNLDQYATYILLSGLIIGLLFAIATIFRKRWSKVTSIAFAFFEGIFAGAYSFYLEKNHPAITLQGITLVYLSLALMLFIYLVVYKPSKTFEYWIDFATKVVVIFYFSSMILGFFGIMTPFIISYNIYGITFSFFVVSVISLRYLINFDLITTAKVSIGKHPVASKFMGWFCAFSISTTVIWLFIESLHLLSKLRH